MRNSLSHTSRSSAALVELHRATDGARWKNGTNWLSAASLSEWAGVTTDADGRVTRLELSDNGLSGTLPGSLGDLTLLEVLDLSRNRLSGALPATLGNLSNLRSLNLHRSWALTGPLPDGLRLLPSLTTLSALRTELCAPRDADFQTWLAGISSSVLTCPPETQSVIDLAVFYPPYILGRHNNADGTLSEEAMTRKLLAGVDLRVEESNRAMRDSGVNARIALVHAGKLEDETSFRRHDDLLRVQQTDDNHWDEVHGLRDKYAADVVWLMFLSGGATFPHLEVSTAHASKAFFVAEYDSTQVFAHELGHVMTLLHDRYQYQGPTGNVVDDARTTSRICSATRIEPSSRTGRGGRVCGERSCRTPTTAPPPGSPVPDWLASRIPRGSIRTRAVTPWAFRAWSRPVGSGAPSTRPAPSTAPATTWRTSARLRRSRPPSAPRSTRRWREETPRP